MRVIRQEAKIIISVNMSVAESRRSFPKNPYTGLRGTTNGTNNARRKKAKPTAQVSSRSFGNAPDDDSASSNWQDESVIDVPRPKRKFNNDDYLPSCYPTFGYTSPVAVTNVYPSYMFPCPAYPVGPCVGPYPPYPSYPPYPGLCTSPYPPYPGSCAGPYSPYPSYNYPPVCLPYQNNQTILETLCGPQGCTTISQPQVTACGPYGCATIYGPPNVASMSDSGFKRYV
jgi:hypothetical protein